MKKTGSPLTSSRNWQEFRQALSGLSAKEKGDRFEELVRHYLLLHPTYSTKLADVWLLSNTPTEVKDHLKLPHTDEGIDLIARTRDGGYWAIQCKYIEDEATSIGRKKLSTFTDLLNFCPNIELGLVCSTTERFSHKMGMYGDRVSFLAADVWRSLDDEFFGLLHRHLENRRVAIKPLSPRPHQKEAVKEAYRHFVKENNSRGKLIMPCGSGKSLTGWWIADRLKSKYILVAVPSLSLIRQTLQVWARESVAHGREINWIAVCSDESVSSNKSDDASVRTQDLGVKIHTNPDEITDWLSHDHDGMTVVFSTYQSGEAVAAASRKAGITYDLAILDEAHKTVGQRDKLFSHLLHDGNISVTNRVFMTATERRYRGDSDEIASMDSPDLYGDTFYLLSFKEALECVPPILSDYKVVTVNVTRREIEQLIAANVLVRPKVGVWDRELEAEMLASLVALRKAMQKYPIKHAVSFHSSISRASAFKDSHDLYTHAFPEYGDLTTYHVTGATPTAERQRIIERFAASPRSLITNARCLTEGVDVPGIDCVLFADPKKSAVDIVQAVGRALRPAPDKQCGYVVIPVVIDEDKPTETPYDAILMILRALASNDERIVEYFRSISQGRKRSSFDIIDIDIPVGVSIDADTFVEAIDLQLWSRLAKLSWRPFEEAREFVRGLGLRSSTDWHEYCNKSNRRYRKPPDIPSNPQKTYKGIGWEGYGDWLGTGYISPPQRKLRSYEDAIKFIHNLGLNSQSDWHKYKAGQFNDKEPLPNDIPKKPERIYKGVGWIDLGKWLGTDVVATNRRNYLSFEEARHFAHNLNLASSSEWFKFCKGELPEKGRLPKNIPANPHNTYKNKGWNGFGDWLGTGTPAPTNWKFKPFEEAREFVHRLNLKSTNEWRRYCKGVFPDKPHRPIDIPVAPNETYKDKGWVSFGDWLGNKALSSRKHIFLSFEKARLFIRALQLKNRDEWRRYSSNKMLEKGRLPDNIPADPYQYYKDKGWVSFGDWLGTESVAPRLKEFRPFADARKFVHALGFATKSEWDAYCKKKSTSTNQKPNNIPVHPERSYKDKGWISWSDWLGTAKDDK